MESPEGDLLRVRSNKNENRFLIYKLIWFLRNSRWEEVKDLGDDALFVGDNHSISVSASDFPGSSQIPYTSAELIGYQIIHVVTVERYMFSV